MKLETLNAQQVKLVLSRLWLASKHTIVHMAWDQDNTPNFFLWVPCVEYLAQLQ